MTSNTQDLSGLSVLGAFAHPDDEGFGTGGTLAMLVSRGARVTLVCATNGDVGEISDPALATPENLAQVRQEEMRQAMAVTGVPDVRFFNYRDSGMVGTEDNNHPHALHQADPDQVIGRLVDIIREVRPQIVLTHDPSGGYGHPDHKAICQHTTQAVAVCGDTTAYPQQLSQGRQVWDPALLYYVCFPRSNFRRLWQQMLDLGIKPPFASLDIESLGSPDEEVTTRLDVSAYVETKIASLDCHRTQMDPDGPFAQIPEELMREIMSTEYYSLVAREGVANSEDVLGRL
ncbi:MAG: PIG-L family deacetylase [Dehalococcoidia bacterium]